MIYILKLKDGRSLSYNSLREIESFERGWRNMLAGNETPKDQRWAAELAACADGSSAREAFPNEKYEDCVSVIALTDAQPKLLKQSPIKTERPKPGYYPHLRKLLPQAKL